jgi:hypothetical protein
MWWRYLPPRRKRRNPMAQRTQAEQQLAAALARAENPATTTDDTFVLSLEVRRLQAELAALKPAEEKPKCEAGAKFCEGPLAEPGRTVCSDCAERYRVLTYGKTDFVNNSGVPGVVEIPFETLEKAPN